MSALIDQVQFSIIFSLSNQMYHVIILLLSRSITSGLNMFNYTLGKYIHTSALLFSLIRKNRSASIDQVAIKYNFLLIYSDVSYNCSFVIKTCNKWSFSFSRCLKMLMFHHQYLGWPLWLNYSFQNEIYTLIYPYLSTCIKRPNKSSGVVDNITFPLSLGLKESFSAYLIVGNYTLSLYIK